mgnify:CR=1 FL=1
MQTAVCGRLSRLRSVSVRVFFVRRAKLVQPLEQHNALAQDPSYVRKLTRWVHNDQSAKRSLLRSAVPRQD